MIPHEEIREKKDRSWTFRLLDMITNSSSGDDVADVCKTLGCLDDPRAVERMLQLLQDVTQPFHLRKAASDVLTDNCTSRSDSDRRLWWNSGDWLLQRQAIRDARTSDAEILMPILKDPYHVFHREAVASLEFGFEEPEFQRLSIQALSHPNPEVREAGAQNLLWDEPVEAEDALIKAIWDLDEDVACRAANTLQWFRSQKAFLALTELGLSGDDHRCHHAPEADAELLRRSESALQRLTGASREHFLRWLKPIEKLLSLEPEEEKLSSACSTPNLPPDQKKDDTRLTAAKEIIELYDDADGCWSEKRYGRVNWSAVNSRDRKILARYLSRHLDHEVRELACEPFGLWDCADALEALLHDPCSGVKKSAAYHLRFVTPDPAVADSLWNSFLDVNCTSTRARETLQSYAVHAQKDGLEDRLADIALNDRRVSRVETAISKLEELNAHAHMYAVLSLLWKPPLVNWEIHRSLVDYCTSQELSVPNFSALCQIDDLDLQEALAEALPFCKPVLLKGLSYAARI